MGKADLTEKNLLRYKDVFSDVANVNLFHGEKVLAEEDIVEEQTELIFKSPVDGNLGQLFLDVPMKCKKAGTDFVFICMENQSDICNGKTSGKYYEKYQMKYLGIKPDILPSTSPANAAYSLGKLVEIWKKSIIY